MDEKKLKAISLKIKSRRIELGYSQEYIAYQLKISQNVYSLNERNIGKIPFERVLEIVAILDIPIPQLLDV